MNKNSPPNSGFALIELLIALTVFSVFIASYVTIQGYNITDSGNLREELKLKDLAQQKINEIITSPPRFTLALTISKETKTFEHDPDYEYVLEYKKMTIPDYNKMSGVKSEDGDKDSQSAEGNLMKKKFKEIKDNLEQLLWQVQVTVKNKTTGYQYNLSAWLLNEDHKVKISTNF
jgi:prepilin-type N-terminal cleavage/methylation domain-containing protein